MLKANPMHVIKNKIHEVALLLKPLVAGFAEIFSHAYYLHACFAFMCFICVVNVGTITFNLYNLE